jgi:putative tryptophan/tyrosine transport system substrate-binding protein
MRRRDFIKVIAGSAAAAWPLTAQAQRIETVRYIGVLMSIAENDPEAQSRIAALREGLEKLGWIEGRNLRIDYRWAAGDDDRTRKYASELVRLTPDVIVANGAAALASLGKETRSIPIVFVQVLDPVASGLVASLARPGGNATGFVIFENAMAGKWLELLKEIVPKIHKVAIIRDPALAGITGLSHATAAAAVSLGVTLIDADVRDANEIDRAIDNFMSEEVGGLIVLPGPITSTHRNQIIALSTQHRLPSVYPYRFFAKSGGLISYGPDNLDLYRRPHYTSTVYSKVKSLATYRSRSQPNSSS